MPSLLPTSESPTPAYPPWTPAELPPELIQDIAHRTVWDDTAMPSLDPHPLCKSRFWSEITIESLSGPKLADCVRDANLVRSGGFLDRTRECSLKVHSTRNGRTIQSARPSGFRHDCLNFSQVCRAWRNALLPYRALWADAALLLPGHIGLSVCRAQTIPVKLVNHRPLCTCLLPLLAPFLGKASEIMFSMPARTRHDYQVSETVFLELLSQSLRPDGSRLKHIDVRISG